jgi:hypothetical protein
MPMPATHCVKVTVFAPEKLGAGSARAEEVVMLMR